MFTALNMEQEVLTKKTPVQAPVCPKASSDQASALLDVKYLAPKANGYHLKPGILEWLENVSKGAGIMWSRGTTPTAARP